MNIEIARDHEVDDLISSSHFQRSWHNLHKNCPWATAFQDFDFVTIWYEIYRTRYEPLLLFATDTAGELGGVLPLAIDRISRTLVVAGTHHAEYQVWLGLPDNGDSFAEACFDLIPSIAPREPFLMRYLPANTPLAWASPGRGGRSRTVVTRSPRPYVYLRNKQDLFDLLESKLKERKGRLRNTRNRLSRIGKLSFKRIETSGELGAILDETIPYYDLRWAAMYGSMPFRQDAKKREFHARLFSQSNLIHATVFKAGDAVLSAHLGHAHSGSISLSYLAYSPFHAKGSPFIHHMMMLMEMAHHEGYDNIDFTPGGGAYKELFATNHDEVFTLTGYSTVYQRIQAGLKGRVMQTAKRTLELAGGDVDRWRKASQKGWRSIAREIRLPWRTPMLASHPDRVSCLYELASSGGIIESGTSRRDCIPDLLACSDVNTGQLSEAYSNAYRRFENGWRVFTNRAEGGALHCAWVAVKPNTEGVPKHLDIDADLPNDSAVIFGFEVFGADPSSEVFNMCLRDALTSLNDRGKESARAALAIVDAENAAARRALQEIGFAHKGDLHSVNRALAT